MAEGPYGRFTVHLGQHRLLLIAGGVGVTPIRSLLGDLRSGETSVVVIYRVHRNEDVLFHQELEALMSENGGVLNLLIGSRASFPDDPLGPASLQRLVPDIDCRDVFVCGPPGMIAAVDRSLTALGVPKARVHHERFALLPEAAHA
jgi:ferredoxin-NADP reductase